MADVKPFKVGFIGAGGIALTHMYHLKKVEGVEFVAASDISTKALDKAKADYGLTNAYSDFKEMLKKHPEMDAVSVCTPNGLHAENSIAALEAGKHVMVEKPMAMNARQAQAMVDASKKAKKNLIVGFQHRFEPKSKVIRDQIASGAFGKILYVRAQALRRRGIPSWGVFGRKDLQGGGPMIDIGVHILEAAHSMIGAPRPVSAVGSTFTYMGDKKPEAAAPWGDWDWKTYTVEDLAVGMIRFDTGTMLTIESSFAAHIEKDIWNVTIMGEKGGASWEGPEIFQDQNGYMMNLKPSFIGKWDHFEYKMKHFVEVCRDGRANECPAEHGLMVQKMLDGLYAAAEKGAEVRID
ncbi:MAG: Gfo/Idh/MocA family oxidoreductase [Anaerolineae bacterium]|nr:Gfo/Idh/MocA family oxidoreductase [Phycisphaerae bacterium]